MRPVASRRWCGSRSGRRWPGPGSPATTPVDDGGVVAVPVAAAVGAGAFVRGRGGPAARLPAKPTAAPRAPDLPAPVPAPAAPAHGPDSRVPWRSATVLSAVLPRRSRGY